MLPNDGQPQSEAIQNSVHTKICTRSLRKPLYCAPRACEPPDTIVVAASTFESTTMASKEATTLVARLKPPWKFPKCAPNLCTGQFDIQR